MSARKILLIEDEPMIAMLLEDFLDMFDYDSIGPAETVESACALVEAGGFDAAIMDINLNGETAWVVADMLKARAIPFAISSGTSDSDIPQAHKNAPLLTKPYMMADVETILDRLFSCGKTE